MCDGNFADGAITDSAGVFALDRKACGDGGSWRSEPRFRKKMKYRVGSAPARSSS